MQAEETETVESVLTGKTVVVTGTLPTLGRKEASELIEKYGGKASGSVSKKQITCLREKMQEAS